MFCQLHRDIDQSMSTFVVVLSCLTSFVISPFKDPQGVLEVEEEVSQTHFHYVMTFCLCQLC